MPQGWIVGIGLPRTDWDVRTVGRAASPVGEERQREYMKPVIIGRE
jgi:hypothetical protein